MKNFLKTCLRYKWWIVILVAVIGGSYYYFTKSDTSAESALAMVETVSRGTVSSGIKTSGTVVAAQKLDLNVYKQSGRIEAVNVTNAGKVKKGDVLISFDKSKAYVSMQSSKVDVAESALALATEQAKYSDPNSTLRTLQNTLVALNQDIVQAEKDIVQATRDYYNSSLEMLPGNRNNDSKTRPTISGVYNGTDVGTYTIKVYASAAASGFSYTVSGLESGTYSVISNIPTQIGNGGLKVSFPSDAESGDEWVLYVPNTKSSEYVTNKAKYEKLVADLQDSMRTKKVEIANTELQIKNEARSDGTSYRDLALSKAQAKLSSSRQQLSENYDVVREQDIVAPFDGTVEGMANVVVGATPTGSTNDSIALGTLISDDFLVKFSLSAVDVAKVSVGQKALVNITSLQGVEPLEAYITEVSSLPQSGTVAQYQVQALITLPASSTITLREGLLAEVEIVQEEVNDALRVPLSAITYENAQPKVSILGALSEAQQKELDSAGFISAVNGIFPSTLIPVELGVVGSFYAEVKSGIEEGVKIVVTKTELEDTAVTEDTFGPPERNEDGSGPAPESSN